MTRSKLRQQGLSVRLRTVLKPLVTIEGYGCGRMLDAGMESPARRLATPMWSQLTITVKVATADVLAESLPAPVTVKVYVPGVVPPAGGGLVTVSVAVPVAAL